MRLGFSVGLLKTCLPDGRSLDVPFPTVTPGGTTGTDQKYGSRHLNLIQFNTYNDLSVL